MGMYADALKYARKRKIVLPSEYYSLDLKARQLAVTVTGLASLDQIEKVVTLVNEFITSGSSFNDFKQQIAESGIDLPEYQLANIYRTNMQTAYSHGKWTQQQRNKIRRPYLMYSAINDSRVRPAHLKLNAIVRHIDDWFWQVYYPPNGYQCRCDVESLTEAEALEKGITPEDDLPMTGEDKGWRYNPTQYGEQFEKIIQERKADSILNADVLNARLDEILIDHRTFDEVHRQISTAFGDLTDQTQKKIDAVLDVTLRKTSVDVAPSAVRMVAELSNDSEMALSTLLKSATDRNDPASLRIVDWMKDSFSSMLRAIGGVKDKLAGNSIKGIAELNLQPGNIVGIRTPTLFRRAESDQKNITILDAKGKAIDLSKINGLDGALLAPDLRLEVISNTGDGIVLQQTQKDATRYFVANQMAFSLS